MDANLEICWLDSPVSVAVNATLESGSLVVAGEEI
jgi:hypothetical protein